MNWRLLCPRRWYYEYAYNGHRYLEGMPIAGQLNCPCITPPPFFCGASYMHTHTYAVAQGLGILLLNDVED